MKSPLRILYLEDDPREAELVQETLASDGIMCHVTRVESEADFLASLEQGGFDLILADYTLPSFDGLSALKIAQQDWPHVPLIFVSGTLGEEVVIEALKIGATDYVFKTRLSRIVPSVQRALREAEERIALTRKEGGGSRGARGRLGDDEIAVAVDGHVGAHRFALDRALNAVGGDRACQHAAGGLRVGRGSRDQVLKTRVGLLEARGLRVRDIAGNVLQSERLRLQAPDGGRESIE